MSSSDHDISSDESIDDNFLEDAEPPQKTSSFVDAQKKKKSLGTKTTTASSSSSTKKPAKSKPKKSLGDTPKAAAKKKTSIGGNSITKKTNKRTASRIEDEVDEYGVVISSSSLSSSSSSSSSSSAAAAAAAAAPPPPKRRQKTSAGDNTTTADQQTEEFKKKQLLEARTHVQRLLNAEHFDYGKLDKAYQKLSNAYILTQSENSKKSNNARLRAARSMSASVRRLNQVGVEAMVMMAVHTAQGKLKCYGSPRFETMVRHPNFTAMARTVFTDKRHHRVTYESPPPMAIVPAQLLGGVDDELVKTSVVTPFYKAVLQNPMTIHEEGDRDGSWNKTSWKKPRLGDEFINRMSNSFMKKKMEAAAAAPAHQDEDQDDAAAEDEDESIVSSTEGDVVDF
jgi:hypothetical protein